MVSTSIDYDLASTLLTDETQDPASAGFLFLGVPVTDRPHVSRLWSTTWLLASLGIATSIYWVGLSGPFLFDDAPNFEMIRPWLAGDVRLSEVLFSNDAWVNHRAFAMLTFASSAFFGGYDPFVFKLGNLIVHLLCGICAFGLTLRLMRMDTQLSHIAVWVALGVTTVWLLHPFHVSTVLYAVQRMTQLAALLCLLGLWLYVAVREWIQQGESRFAWPLLFVAIPALSLLGIQSKQSAAVLPLLCLVVEIVWFRQLRPVPRAIQAFFALFVFIPALAVAALLALRPANLLAGYAEYDFSPWERVLSQGRVLCHYLKQLLAPHTPSMGVFTDDYVVSSSLLSPASTLLAIFLLAALSYVAWRLRRAQPAFMGGWLFFLAAHAVESSFLPLELYYEHRNYLPSLGIFIALASVLHAAAGKLQARGIRPGRVGIAGMAALVVVLATLTYGRARVWADPVLLVESELRQHPKSARAVINYMGVANDLGNTNRAYAVADATIAAASREPHLRGQIMLFRSSLNCISNRPSNLDSVEAAIDALPSHLTLTSFLALDQLATHVASGNCTGLSASAMASALARAADHAMRQPDDFPLKWALRNRAAMLYAQDANWKAAAVQARKGWQPSTPGGGAASLVEIFLMAGDLEQAQRVYSEAWRKTSKHPQLRRDLAQILPSLQAAQQAREASKEVTDRSRGKR